jgi:hypothetical protein
LTKNKFKYIFPKHHCQVHNEDSRLGESHMTIALDHDQLESLLLRLNPTDLQCRAKILQLRRLMDEACDQRAITMKQWRSLLERISFIQAKHALIEPGAWRRPPASGDGSPEA